MPGENVVHANMQQGCIVDSHGITFGHACKCEVMIKWYRSSAYKTANFIFTFSHCLLLLLECICIYIYIYIYIYVGTSVLY